jgi:hypothetical protein
MQRCLTHQEVQGYENLRSKIGANEVFELKTLAFESYESSALHNKNP